MLLEGVPGNPTALDHLGVEVGDTASVIAAAERLSSSGLETGVESGARCCYAVQDKVWVTGPGDEPWEVYAVLADDRRDLEGVTDLALSAISGGGGCCASDEEGRSIGC